MIEEEEVCWHTFKKVTKLESDLNKLEENSMHRQLTEQEKLERKQLHDSLWVAAQAHQSLLRQKSRWRWLKEGDCNTGFFHLLMNANRNRNSIRGVFIDGSWTDDPHKVKEEVKSFFFHRFQEPIGQRPKIDGIRFQTVNLQQNNELLAPFMDEEIQKAIFKAAAKFFMKEGNSQKDCMDLMEISMLTKRKGWLGHQGYWNIQPRTTWKMEVAINARKWWAVDQSSEIEIWWMEEPWRNRKLSKAICLVEGSKTRF